MTQIDRNRFFNMAECYDAMAPYLVPQYEFLQEQALALINEPRLIVDLGAGSGRFLERAMNRFPHARAVWVDYSDDFLRVARTRLASFADRVTFVLRNLEHDWESALASVSDAIFSMSAIHHLASSDKQRLYQRCFDALAPGGWFINIDEISTIFDDAYRATLHRWVNHVDSASAAVPYDLQPQLLAWRERFDLWKKRNVDSPTLEKRPGDDIHEPFLDQLHWLKSAGFERVDLFVKFHLWSIIGGRKPG